jgi:hypothetical protein
MKIRILVGLLNCALWLGASLMAQAQGTTAFTYQGRLTDSGSPANGDYDLQFTLYNAPTSGGAVGNPVTNRPVAVSNGLFATVLDFGASAFNGSPRWLELGVRTNGSAADYSTLSPRQFISFVPYSITALNLAGTVPGGGLAGTYTNALTLANTGNSLTGNGAGLTGLNAANLASGTVGDARLSPNVALLNASQTFSGVNTLLNPANTLAGNGAGLTALNAGTIANGTLGDGRLSGNVPLLNASQAFSGVNSLLNPGNSLAGNGAGLTALNAGNIASGTLADARLSFNVPLLSAQNVFSASNYFAGVTLATNPNNVVFGTFTGSLIGNITGAATTAGDFTGLLAGDVTGPQGATVVSAVGGQGAANVASGVLAANGATAANVPGTIMKRDGSGNTVVGALSALTLSGDGAGVANLNAGSVASGTLADARLSGNVPLLDRANAFTRDNTFTGILTATNASNVLNGTFAGNLTGTVQGSLIGPASTATNFSAPLSGDVTGPQGATVVSTVGGQSAANVASGAAAANNATAANVPGSIVKRDALGNLVAGGITAATLSGDGAGVGNLNASSVASGTLADARLSGNVPLLKGSQAFTGVNTFGNAGNSFAGTFAGDGAGVTNLNGASIVNGTVGSAQLGASAVQTANIAAGAVGNTQLASGSAAANLQDIGQSGVGSGGMIWSTNPASATLFSAGYIRAGRMDYGANWDGSPGDTSPRHGHVAIWTGSEMILWGGANGTNFLNDGAGFKPGLSRWTSLPTNGAPSARGGHSAVWTGSEMIIWGAAKIARRVGVTTAHVITRA